MYVFLWDVHSSFSRSRAPVAQKFEEVDHFEGEIARKLCDTLWIIFIWPFDSRFKAATGEYCVMTFVCI